MRPELTHILGLVAGVSSRDVVLDQFAGYGAIPLEIIAGFSPQKVIAVEQNPALAARLKVVAADKRSLIVHQGDAQHLSYVPDLSVTHIITDPPWGQFAAAPDLSRFYLQVLQEAVRVLRAGGVAVVLTGAPHEFRRALAHLSVLAEVKHYNVLVSGKKAEIIKLRKDS